MFHDQTCISIIFGIVSLFFRQTNIVWIFFSSMIAILYQKTKLGEIIRTMDKEILDIQILPTKRYFYDEIIGCGTHLGSFLSLNDDFQRP